MKRKVELVAGICILLAVLVGIHQHANYGLWFDLKDIHHETFIVALVSFAVGIIFSEKLEET